MQRPATIRGGTLSAIFIAPDRALALEFSNACSEIRVFEILMDLKTYPSEQTLEIRMKQLQPAAVLIDVATDAEAADRLIGFVSHLSPDISVVAIDRRSDSDTILRTLRAGAAEYLYAPFDPANTSEAVARLLRLRKPEVAAERELGAVFAFSSVKPGSGASTLATQCAFALRRTGGKRVLLADLDLMGGTTGFYLKLDHSFSVLDALEQTHTLSASSWTSMIASTNGVDVLTAPLAPWSEHLEITRLQNLIDFARTM